MPKFLHVSNPMKPLSDFKSEKFPAGTSIKDYLSEKKIPEDGIVAIVDGDKITSENWDQPLASNQKVIIYCNIGSTFVIAIIVLLVVAIALFFFLPVAPGETSEEGDSVYTLKGQKNQKKLGQPIEKHYGRMRIFPSYMAAPFTRFKNNDQYLYALFCLGLGKYEVHNIKIEDSPIASFDDVEWEIYEPNQKVKLFPTNVQTAAEVAGIELYGPNQDEYPDGGWSGPFPVCSPGSLAYKIEIDISFRQGLYQLEDDGGTDTANVQILFQSRLINDNGNPIGDWVDLEGPNTFDVESDSTTALRKTKGFTVAEGRYQVRGKRLNDQPESLKFKSQVHWETLRSFNDKEQNFGNVTLLAVIAKASNNLNDSSKSAFNVELTSILKVYNSATQIWELLPTRNPAWAFCDIIKAKYGKGIGYKFIDVPRLSALADQFQSSGIRFDGSFDTNTTIWSALQTVMNVGKAVPIIRGGLISAVRDAPNIIPTLGFSGDNIVKGSVTVQTKLVNHSEHDGLEVKYLDNSDWKFKTVSCLVGIDRGLKCKQVTLIGCVNRDRAYRWGMYQRAVEVYQTDNISFETGIEGGTAVYGDIIAIKHETLLSENDFVELESGRLEHDALMYYDTALEEITEIISAETVTIITLPFSPTFEIGKTYRIALRDKIGTVHGPYQVFETETPNMVTLSVPLVNSEFNVAETSEAAMYWFGENGQEYTLAKITKIEPGGSEDSVKITAVPYNDKIYSFDLLNAPEIGEPVEPPDIPNLPTVTNLQAKPALRSASPEVVITWRPALGATHYLIYKSLNGVDFEFVASALYSGYILPVKAGNLWLRVRGVNIGAGPFAEWNGPVGAPTTAPDVPTGIALKNPFDDLLEIKWNADFIATSYVVKILIGAVEILTKSFNVNNASFTKAYLENLATRSGVVPMGRAFKVSVQSVNSVGSSAFSPEVIFTNAPPAAPTNLTSVLVSGTNHLISWQLSEPDDLQPNYKVYASTVNGFIPDPVNLVVSPATKSANLDAPTPPLYFRVASLDIWGTEESMSEQAVIL